MPFIIDGTTGFNLPSGADLTVNGNFTVSGTTTTISTETLTVDDNIIVLNNNEAGTPSENAGIEVERGTSTNVSIRWNETTDKWQFTNDGTTYTDIGAGGDVVDDTTPQLGGDLSTNGHSIIINQSALITGEVLRFNNSSGTFGTVLYRNSALSDFYMSNYVGHLNINNSDSGKNIIITTDGLIDLNANAGNVDITSVGGTVTLAGDTSDMTFTNTGTGKFVMTGSTSDAYLKVYTASASQGARGLTIGSSSENDWFIERSASNNDLKFYYNPSTRMKITSNGVIEGASDAEIKTSPIRIHSNTISTNTTIASTENAVSGGPITIASSVTVTVDGDWTVV